MTIVKVFLLSGLLPLVSNPASNTSAPTRPLPTCQQAFPNAGPEDHYTFIDGNKIYLDGVPGVRSASLEYEILRLFENEPNFRSSGKVQEFRLDNLTGEDLDVISRFIYIDGKIRVFWRESYVNRSYIFGIVDIAGDAIIPRCQDHGGVEMSH